MPFFKRSPSQKRLASRGGVPANENDGPPTLSHFEFDTHGSVRGQEKDAMASSSKNMMRSNSQDPSNGIKRTPIDKTLYDKNPFTPPSSPPTTQSSHRVMSRSPSASQALPYHRPWNRNLTSNESETNPSFIRQQPTRAMSELATYSSVVPNFDFSSLSLTKDQETNTTHAGQPLDFRVSTLSSNNKTPSSEAGQRKQVLNAGRKVNRRKGKAPADLNVMVVGGKMTGKTSWIRTFLSTMDLSQCSEEVKFSASHFGISPSHTHITRDTDPITPIATKSINYLGGIDLLPSSLLPLAALDSGNHDLGSLRMRTRTRAMSFVSERASLYSTGTGYESGKIRFSICDTPGIDFEVEDDFEIDRSATKLVKYVEEKMSRTLSEEGKVQRRARPEDHIHLVLYFIDPRHLVERTASRRRDILEARHGKSEDARKSRSNSESLSNGRHDFPGGPMKRSESSPQTLEKAGSREDNDYCVEGLSSAELTVLTRLSRLANVLPIIAKADTLTESKMEEVRQAVRYSLKKANVNLGIFDVSDQPKKKPVMKANIDDVGAFDMDDDREEVVKVIKTRRGRTFSTVGAKRPSEADWASTVGHGQGSEDSHGTGAHNSSNEEEGDQEQSKEEIARMIPLSIFVPEPVKINRNKKSSNGHAKGYRNGSQDMGDFIPPVPPLPRELSDQSGFGDVLDRFTTDRRHRNEAERSPQKNHHHHHYSQSPPRPLPTATVGGSSRFRRHFRWGSANVLDPQQCDFGLVRTAILGPQLEELRESTALRYEVFRSKRLELNRVLRETEERLGQK